MGGAVARAVCKGAGAETVLLANRTSAKAEALAAELGCTAGDNRQVAAECHFIFLGVKPQVMPGMLAQVAPVLAGRKDAFVLVTMAAGLSMARIRELAGGDYPIIRIMPNTPAAVGAGMVQYCSRDVSDADLHEFLTAMAPAGLLDAIDEDLIDAASCVSGCGPAWAYQFIEALADGGVAGGSAPGQGPDVRSPDAAGQCPAGAGKRAASRRSEGRGVQPGRLHHPGSPRAGGACLPRPP